MENDEKSMNETKKIASKIRHIKPQKRRCELNAHHAASKKATSSQRHVTF